MRRSSSEIPDTSGVTPMRDTFRICGATPDPPSDRPTPATAATPCRRAAELAIRRQLTGELSGYRPRSRSSRDIAGCLARPRPMAVTPPRRAQSSRARLESTPTGRPSPRPRSPCAASWRTSHEGPRHRVLPHPLGPGPRHGRKPQKAGVPRSRAALRMTTAAD